MQIVSVVDAGPGYVTIQHVDVAAQVLGMSRMCGVWVVSDQPRKVELLARDRMVVLTAEGAAALHTVSGRPSCVLDLDQTIQKHAHGTGPALTCQRRADAAAKEDSRYSPVAARSRPERSAYGTRPRHQRPASL